MFYYAKLNENMFVVDLVASETEITDNTYISITEDQFTNGDLLWLYYKPATGQFVVCDNFIGSSDWIIYKNTDRPITPKFDEIDSELAGKADSDHNHDSEYAALTHTHAEYAAGTHNHDDLYAAKTHETNTTIHVTAAEKNAWNGKAAADHNHDSEYAEINHVHTGFAGTEHTHNTATATTAGFISASDKAKLDGIAAGATAYTHPETHPASMITETDSRKFMTAAERTKLSGIAENANNYVHPATHAASMITGLSNVATSGDYEDLANKPTIPTIPESLPANGGNADTIDGYHASAFATVQHNHDLDYAAVSHTHGQSDITGLTSALNGKANASHTHGEATSSAAGFMSATDKTKLDGIASNANNYTHPASHSLDMITETTAKKVMTAAERTKLAGIAENANLYTHPSSHAMSMITGLETALEGKAAATHTHGQSDITGLVSALNGKASASHTHGEATTAAAGFMSAADKTKLNGIAAGANAYTHPASHPASMITGLAGVATSGSYNDLSNKPTIPAAYTHPASHPASMITGLSSVATSGSYNDLTNKPSTFTPAAHTHAQSEISGLASALSGKAAASHNHDSAYISKDLLGLNDAGGVEYSFGSGSGKNVLTEISNMPQGIHTIYAITGTAGNPDARESYRYFVHKTSSTIGWIMAYSAQGAVYANYQSGAGTFKGWRVLHDAERVPLWTGGRYMTADHTITPSKKLSECEHGYLLLWSDYDPDTSTINNSDFCTTMIPNRSWAGGTWNGAAYYCDIPRFAAGTATDSESRIIKVLYVYDNKLVGNDNNKAAPRNDVVLRAVYEF